MARTGHEARMAARVALCLGLGTFSWACGTNDGHTSPDAGAPADAGQAGAAGDQARAGPATSTGSATLATADPYARGYTDDDFPRIQEIAPRVFTYEQLRSAGDERFTTVSLFVVADDEVLVADGQGSVEETQRMLDHLSGLTDTPVGHVVVASDHGDHTGGNAAFPDGATFYAHPTSADNLRTSGSARAADVLVADSLRLDVGGRAVDLLFLGRAHTGGDLMVWLPEERVLFMSEAYLHRVFPAMRTAYPSEWVEVVERAQAMDARIYVPGHGFVDDPATLRSELDVYRQALETVIAEATRLHAAGVPVEQAMEQARFGDLEEWSLRSSQGARAVQQVYAELDGELGAGGL